MLDTPPSSQKINFLEHYYDLFHASTSEVSHIHVPKLHYLSSTGIGLRSDEDGFWNVIQGVQGIAYSLKFRLKRLKEQGFTDYIMPPSEAVRSHTDKTPEQHTRRVLLLQPISISNTLLQEALRIAATKHPESPLPVISYETRGGHDALHCIHLGPYKTIDSTVEKIQTYAKSKGMTLRQDRHEIYLNDPRKTRPEALQTIVRFSILPA